MSRRVTVSPAAPADRVAAARMLFADAPDPDAAAAGFLAQLADGDADPAGLFAARHAASGRLAGAIYAYLIGGRQGAVGPPAVPDGPDRTAVEDSLVRAALDWFRAEQVQVAQAVLRAAERPRAAALERDGFRHVTRLVFLGRDLAPDDPAPADSPLTFRPVPGPTAAFADALLATYDGTLDCPELNGTRPGDEILAGYLAASPVRPPLWWLAEDGATPVGVLLLAPRDDGPAAELTYLGLIPSARGLGLGRHLLRFALRQAAARGCSRLLLSVDERNEPALRLYRGHGFRPFDRRDVFLLLDVNSSGNSLK